MMEFGYFTDKGLPNNLHNLPPEKELYKVNSFGYRCPEWDPMPSGKKNVVILGCSHTFGQGLAEDEHWVHFLSQHNTQRLRYWNIAQPGASADLIVRTLYGTEQTIYPSIIIVCWPLWSRREMLSSQPKNLTGGDANVYKQLLIETDDTDKNNFLMNVFHVEKFAQKNKCKTFHCFADESYQEHIKGLNVLEDYTIKNCWPYWDKFDQRTRYEEPSLAADGQHYGKPHHKRFAELFVNYFGRKLK